MARFLGVGIVGFLVDAALLTLLFRGLEANIYLARACSFGSATLVTWSLNRRYTFGTPHARVSVTGEYVRYLAVQALGALTNLACFSFLIEQFKWMKLVPILPLAVGAVFGLAINYLGSRFLVFRVPPRTGTFH
jgi:putative flippase GtrA